jgi:hypothetical protein
MLRGEADFVTTVAIAPDLIIPAVVCQKARGYAQDRRCLRLGEFVVVRIRIESVVHSLIQSELDRRRQTAPVSRWNRGI